MNHLILSSLEGKPLSVVLPFLFHYQNISRVRACSALNVTMTTLSNWFTGHTKPHRKKIPELALLLSCPESLLLASFSAVFQEERADIPLSQQRKQLGLSLSEVSGFLRIGTSLLSKWETGSKLPSPYSSVLLTLYRLLRVSAPMKTESLSAMRLRKGLSVRETARALCFPEKLYWKWEWKNAVPLPYADLFACFYNIPVSLIPLSPGAIRVNRASSLRYIRAVSGLSLPELRTSLGFSSLTDYEAGLAVPNEQAFTRLLGSLGKSPAAFLSGNPRPVLYARLEFFRMIRTPYCEETLCRRIKTTPGLYRKGHLSPESIRIFTALTGAKPYQLYLPLTSIEKTVLTAKPDPSMLRLARNKAGIPIPDAAAALSISVSTLRAYENGTRTPPRFLLDSLSSRYSTGIISFFQL